VAEALAWLSYEALGSGLPEEFKPLRAHVEAARGGRRRRSRTGSCVAEDSRDAVEQPGLPPQDVADYNGAREAYERRWGSPSEPTAPTIRRSPGTSTTWGWC